MVVEKNVGTLETIFFLIFHPQTWKVNFNLLTLLQLSHGLTVGKYCLDVDAHGSLWAVLAPDNAKAQALVARALLEGHGLDGKVVTALARKGAELGRLLEKKD